MWLTKMIWLTKSAIQLLIVLVLATTTNGNQQNADLSNAQLTAYLVLFVGLILFSLVTAFGIVLFYVMSMQSMGYPITSRDILQFKVSDLFLMCNDGQQSAAFQANRLNKTLSKLSMNSQMGRSNAMAGSSYQGPTKLLLPGSTSRMASSMRMEPPNPTNLRPVIGSPTSVGMTSKFTSQAPMLSKVGMAYIKTQRSRF